MQAINSTAAGFRLRALLPKVAQAFSLNASPFAPPSSCDSLHLPVCGTALSEKNLLNNRNLSKPIQVFRFQLNGAFRGMAAKAFTIGGIGAQPSLDDVVKIAHGGLAVALDAAGAERVKKESPPPKSFQPEAFAPSVATPDPSQPLLSQEQARAVLATRLLTVMNGRSGTRVQVAEYLVALLNKNLLPALPAAASDAQVLSALADACHGSGMTTTTAAEATSQPLPEALSGCGLSAPGLSSTERQVLVAGCSASAGVGALAVTGGKRLLSLATATAALSCEALGVQVCERVSV